MCHQILKRPKHPEGGGGRVKKFVDFSPFVTFFNSHAPLTLNPASDHDRSRQGAPTITKYDLTVASRNVNLTFIDRYYTQYEQLLKQ